MTMAQRSFSSVSEERKANRLPLIDVELRVLVDYWHGVPTDQGSASCVRNQQQ